MSWLAGGRTDMANLIGLCTGCHTLVHQGHLRCTADAHGGAVFHTADGTPIPDTPRHTIRRYHQHLDTEPGEQDPDTGPGNGPDSGTDTGPGQSDPDAGTDAA